MTNTSESDEAQGYPPKPVRPPIPKRGAFPTPKSEIQKAKQYIPDNGENDFPEWKSDLPTDVDGEK